jgi:hypothetical protein
MSLLPHHQPSSTRDRRRNRNANYHADKLDHPYAGLPFGWLYPPAFTDGDVEGDLQHALHENPKDFAIVRDQHTQQLAAFRKHLRAPNMILDYQGQLNPMQASQQPGLCVSYLDHDPSSFTDTIIFIDASFLQPR